MSPGGAKPLTSPTSFSLRPIMVGAPCRADFDVWPAVVISALIPVGHARATREVFVNPVSTRS
jgi:hypothetical protein